MGEGTSQNNAAASKENLKPTEVELRRLEDLARNLKNEMTYLRTREAAHRNTNGMSRLH